MPSPREAKKPENMTKAALLWQLGRKLSKDELVAVFKAVGDGYTTDLDDMGKPTWRHNETP